MKDNSIPIAIPIVEPINLNKRPYLINPNLHLPYRNDQYKDNETNNDLIACRNCSSYFIRMEKDKYSSSYFRCEKCRKLLLFNSITNSCLIS